jgi:hypothetical protein
MQSRFSRLTVRISLLCGLTAILAAQSAPIATVSVRQLPPEAFPVGPCSASEAGFLGVVGKDGKERTKLTDEEIGSFVSKRINEGYSVTLHPQVSGRIYAIADCHSVKH